MRRRIRLLAMRRQLARLSAGHLRRIQQAATVPPQPPAATEVPAGYVSKAMLGDKWPLTIPEGVVSCEQGNLVVLRYQGKTYAVNGTAKGAAKKYGWLDAETVQNREVADTGLLKYPITPILDVGLKLC